MTLALYGHPFSSYTQKSGGARAGPGARGLHVLPKDARTPGSQSGGPGQPGSSGTTGRDPGGACVETILEPDCTNVGEGDTCPDGTEPASCGGDGHPCCCGPRPDPATACAPAPDCEGGPATCACLDPCPSDHACRETAVAGRLQCEMLPPP